MLLSTSDPTTFNTFQVVVEKAEELAEQERQDLAVRIARAMAGKST